MRLTGEWRTVMPKRADGMTDRQAAELIRDHGKTLIAQAKAANFDMLAYLLELAVTEAEETITRLRSEQQSGKER